MSRSTKQHRNRLLEFSDKVRRVNIRHEALLMKRIEKMNRDLTIQIDRIETSIKAIEKKTDVDYDRLVRPKYKEHTVLDRHQDETDDVGVDRTYSFLDAQVKSYKRSLKMMKGKKAKEVPLLHTLFQFDQASEIKFDAFFPSLPKNRNIVAEDQYIQSRITNRGKKTSTRQ